MNHFVLYGIFDICSLVDTCWERNTLLALLYMMFLVFCHFPLWCPGPGVVFLIVSIPNLCLFPYSNMYRTSCVFFSLTVPRSCFF